MRLSSLIANASPVAGIIISVALMLFSGFAMTRLTKLARLPNVTGYILAGILIGPYVLNLVPQRIIDGTDFLSDIALAFIAFSTGEFFKLPVLKKSGMKVVWITVFEAVLASVFIFILTYFILRLDLAFSIVLAAIASATAPASTMMTIRQTGAKGDFVATLLPIDKIIGKIYPLFAIALIFMAVGILAMLFWHHPSLPELTDGVANTHPDGLPIFPMMFVSIACGAISGFHATQSPMMARCMTSEKYGRPVFYGAMITEGIVALIWAAAATYFFHTDEGTALFAASSGNDNAAIIVNSITRDWLGTLGGLLAVLGVIAAPITSGDTAFRSARLIVADFMRLDQRPILKRLAISVPLFVAGFVILQIDFAVLWRYFAWCNQTLAVFTLWALTVYLVRERKLYAITLIPALFMTAVCSTYIFIAGEGLALSRNLSYALGGAATLAVLGLFLRWKRRYEQRNAVPYRKPGSPEKCPGND